MFEYSNATPGAFENGIPARAIAARNASLCASCRSPHGLSSGNPSEWVRRWRSVISGESAVAFGSPASSGIHFDDGVVERELPLVAEPEDRERREALRHRRDPEDRVRVHGGARRPAGAPPLREDELAVHDDAEHGGRELLLLDGRGDGLLDGGERRDELRPPACVGERRRRDVGGRARGGRRKDEERNERQAGGGAAVTHGGHEASGSKRAVKWRRTRGADVIR